MDFNLHNFVSYWQGYTYFALFIGMFLDANFTILGAVLLLNAKVLNAGFVLLAVVLGAVGEQLLWYGLGRVIGKKDTLSTWADRVVGRYDSHLLNRTTNTLIITKFIYGLHRAALVRAGMLRIGIHEFLKAMVLVTFCWILVVGSIGLAFTASYNAAKKYLHYAEFFLLVLVVLIILVQFFVSRRLKKDL